LYINDIPVAWIVLSIVVMQFMNLYRIGVDGYRKWKGIYHTHRALSQNAASGDGTHDANDQ
jgi:hypothetical protein